VLSRLAAIAWWFPDRPFRCVPVPPGSIPRCSRNPVPLQLGPSWRLAEAINSGWRPHSRCISPVRRINRREERERRERERERDETRRDEKRVTWYTFPSLVRTATPAGELVYGEYEYDAASTALWKSCNDGPDRESPPSTFNWWCAWLNNGVVLPRSLGLKLSGNSSPTVFLIADCPLPTQFVSKKDWGARSPKCYQ